jgi:hypothetical protein
MFINDPASVEDTRATPRHTLRGLLRPRILALVGAGIAAAGFALNWEWLTALGAAPILLSLAPCAAMCALGLCMRGGASSGCEKRMPGNVTTKSPDVLPQRSAEL